MQGSHLKHEYNRDAVVPTLVDLERLVGRPIICEHNNATNMFYIMDGGYDNVVLKIPDVYAGAVLNVIRLFAQKAVEHVRPT